MTKPATIVLGLAGRETMELEGDVSAPRICCLAWRAKVEA